MHFPAASRSNGGAPIRGAFPHPAPGLETTEIRLYPSHRAVPRTRGRRGALTMAALAAIEAAGLGPNLLIGNFRLDEEGFVFCSRLNREQNRLVIELDLWDRSIPRCTLPAPETENRPLRKGIGRESKRKLGPGKAGKKARRVAYGDRCAAAAPTTALRAVPLSHIVGEV
jgi:hypothetical protein